MRFEYADARMPVAMTKDGSTYYLTYDQVGSLRSVANTATNVLKRINYDSFGNIIEDTNPLFEIPFGFAGGLHDRDTGLVRFGYRDYDPDTARWTAKDPIGFAGGDTDLYGYCLNDPVNFVDPEGLWSITASFYWGYGGSITLGSNKGRSFVRAAGGVGVGGGIHWNPTGNFPVSADGSPCGAKGFIGASANIGASLGPISGGLEGHAGLTISKGANERPKTNYSEQGGFQGSLTGERGGGLRLQGNLNIVDVGFAW
ncbi:MAG: RHS repeat-associated core domain-containing protein [Deltaproteobacteria bacterium]|nr:RHS repeat-associated core domain-containing protein [Deltaproteobacteria bacterium]